MINCTPKLGGQFELESGGQFAPKLVVNLHWNRMVNLTGFSTEGKFDGEMSFKQNKIRVIEFDTDYINSLKLIVEEEKKK